MRRRTAGSAISEAQIPEDIIFRAQGGDCECNHQDFVEAYIVSLIAASRRPSQFGEKLKGWISIGASPRGSIGLDRCSRVWAWLNGRDYVTPEDIQAVAHDSLRHRISLSYEATAEDIA